MPIESIAAAPLKGFQLVIVGGNALFVSNDGKYLMQGTLYDMTRQADLGEEAMKGLRVELLRTIPVKDRIVFAPPSSAERRVGKECVRPGRSRWSPNH